MQSRRRLGWGQQNYRASIKSYLQSAPKFHRQLYTAVIRPRCCGWQSSVSKTGDESCAILLPKPRTNLPPTYTMRCQHNHCRIGSFGRTSVAVAESSNEATQNHEDAANCDGSSTSPPICHVRSIPSVLLLNHEYGNTYTKGKLARLPIW